MHKQARLSSRRSARGFTLVELAAVLAMISIVVVSVSPSFVRLMRDRRVNRAAMHLVDMYRMGRTHAMGRGRPMIVLWEPTRGLNNAEPGTQGRIELWEPTLRAIDPNAQGAMMAQPVPNCRQMEGWALSPVPPLASPATNTIQWLTFVDFKNGKYTNTSAVFTDDQGQQQGYSQICFMPQGQSYIRTADNAPFRRMAGVASFAVTNLDPNNVSNTHMVRTVFIPPNGVARLQL